MDSMGKIKNIELSYDLPKGATAFLIKAKKHKEPMKRKGKNVGSVSYLEDAPLQPGDEFYFKTSTYDRMKDYEENGLDTCMDFDKLMSQNIELDIKVCVSIKPKMVNKLNMTERENLVDFNTLKWTKDEKNNFTVPDWIDQKFGQGTYEQNDYFFIITFKEKA